MLREFCEERPSSIVFVTWLKIFTASLTVNIYTLLILSYTSFYFCVLAENSRSLHCEKFSNINDMFKQVIRILMNCYISTGILRRITSYSPQNIPVVMGQFTRTLMTCLNVSFMLQNFFLRVDINGGSRE